MSLREDIHIWVNGKEHKFAQQLTITQLLAELCINPNIIAIECNCEIVPKSQYDRLRIQEGDKIEIIGFVGGG